jgi:CysZ protein
VTLLIDVFRALAQIDDARFIRVIVKGIAMTLAALLALSTGVVVLVGWIVPDTVALPWIGEIGFVGTAAVWASASAMLLLSMVLIVPAAAFAIGFFLDDVAAAVEARHYAQLPPARELTLSTQVADGLRFLGIVAGANLLALAAYLAVPPLAPILFWSLNGYLLAREYFYLVSVRRLDPGAARALWRRHRLGAWLTGTVMAVPLTVPVVNLVVPVLGVAVFTHQVHRLARPARA